MSIRLAQMQQTPQMQRMAPLSAPTIMPQQPGVAGQFAAKAAEKAAAQQLAETGLAESGLLGGVAAEMTPGMVGQLAGGWFAGGGPIGGNQTKEALKEARALGALTQSEYLKAMTHAGYKNDGGEVRRQALAQAGLLADLPGGPLTAKNYMARERAMEQARAMANQNLKGMYDKMDKKAMGVQYRNIGGLTPGPLGMSDMLKAGSGKDVSKVTYKKKGGEVEDVVEIAYHAPLSNKPSE